MFVRTPKKTRLATAVSLCILTTLATPSIALAGPPSNDDFADRKVIGATPYLDGANTFDATVEPGEALPYCGSNPGHTIWYEFTSPGRVAVEADTFGSDFDTILAVWKGDSFDNFEDIACNDDSDGLDSYVSFSAQPGQTYYLQVAGYGESNGDVVFNLSTFLAGSISGIVTEEGGGPLETACVDLYDAVRGDWLDWRETSSSGTYLFDTVPEGSYRIEFWDCDYNDDHESEWYDNKPSWSEADEIVITGANQVTGIDAELSVISGPPLGVYVWGQGRGTVTSDPAGIECTSSSYCEDHFPWDSVVTLTATPQEGSVLGNWWGCDSVDGNTCTVTMYSARYVDAAFELADTEPPDTTIYVGPEALTRSRSAAFYFSSNEPEEAFECSLDGHYFDLCTQPAEYSDLPDGPHTFQVRAIDTSGNADPSPAEWRWTVDNSAPDLAFERPTAGSYVNDQSIGGAGPIVVVGMVSVEVRAGDTESGVSEVGFEVNGTPVDPSRVTFENGLYRFAFRPAAPGSHNIRARATNGVGLTGSATIQVLGVPG